MSDVYGTDADIKVGSVWRSLGGGFLCRVVARTKKTVIHQDLGADSQDRRITTRTSTFLRGFMPEASCEH